MGEKQRQALEEKITALQQQLIDDAAKHEEKLEDQKKQNVKLRDQLEGQGKLDAQNAEIMKQMDTDFTEQINNLKTEKGELEQQASDAKKKMVLHDQEKKKHVQELEQKKNEISALTEQAKKIPELEGTVREQK